ncbi:LuxR C-terminal-related transcriptional regulator [Sphaerotilus microaerophilus]|uniref:GerE family transcriptional regulator n=1 Tax=Sphaerotilus microaerophilus TaxID=2914710 RepID=A0ABM7YN24_9BURK|nr:LuxR C-terminal-related transcriptional regulator [Sphaerotilus sp. FB-5]BDI05877.1 GerE family transcriptional regulator [Sphaerotilus sp. FB-5]
MSFVSAPGSAPLPDDLLLKVTPPRVPRQQLTRGRLAIEGGTGRQQRGILVQAPGGFGKTSLLAQWRREYLARGSAVAWLSAQGVDDAARLLHALALSVRVGAARPAFGHTLLDAATPGDLEGCTVWLAEVAQAALDLVLIVDEADHLGGGARDALGYLLRNAPPNLRMVVAARSDCQLGVDDLLTYGHCRLLGPVQLRFELDETLALAQARCGDRLDADTAARLHELTEGWPLGLQLALTVLAGGQDARSEVAAMAAHGSGGLREHLVALLLANLVPSDLDFLVRIAALEALHPQLCDAVMGATAGAATAVERLTRLARDTPILAASEGGEWLRMHTLARDALRQRLAALPRPEQDELHRRAADWLAAHGQVEPAARHAWAAGETERAYGLLERSLYDSIMARGRQGAVLDWLARLPPAELDRRPRLLLAAAWSLALSERHLEAERLIVRLLAQDGVDDALRCECALIRGGAAIFADEPDRFVDHFAPWPDASLLQDPLLQQVHANRTAFRTLLEGQPALARRRQQQAPQEAAGGALGAAQGHLDRWGEFIIGLTHLWEGQVLLAERVLRPALARAEAELGRRAPLPSMLAALLAAATWEKGLPGEAAALLANRLDVLERSGVPEAVLLAYRTLARIAGAAGDEPRALELLGALEAVGQIRALPRLRLASLADQVRLHARRFRAETCRALCEQMDALLAEPGLPEGPLWRRSVQLLRDLAQGHAAIAAQAWRAAELPLERADALARLCRLGRLHIELVGLRAFVLDRCGEDSRARMQEVADLAQSAGLARVFDDAHPALGDWVRQSGREPRGLRDAGGQPFGLPLGGPGPLAAPMRAPLPPPPAETAPRAAPSMALTPKEREVMVLLARNLSNKEIGLAMQVGEETIKWHMKNLFAKLDAGTRKQVVQRARILGLLEVEG